MNKLTTISPRTAKRAEQAHQPGICYNSDDYRCGFNGMLSLRRKKRGLTICDLNSVRSEMFVEREKNPQPQPFSRREKGARERVDSNKYPSQSPLVEDAEFVGESGRGVFERVMVREN